MWKKVFILMVLGIVVVTKSHPTTTKADADDIDSNDSSSTEVEVEESITTTLRNTMTSGDGDETLNGNYSDSVVVEAVVADESSESGVGSETDEAKEFDPNDCFLDKERGPCRAVIDSWFYNKETRSCEYFMWSGCGGNRNRFAEDKKCQQVCNNVTLDGLTPPATNTNTNPNSTSTTTTTTPVSTTTPMMTTTTTMKTTTSPVVAKSSSAVKNTCPKFQGCSNKGCIVVQEASTHGCKICQCSDSDMGTVKITRSTSSLSTEVNKNPVIGSVSGQPSKPVNETTGDDESDSKEVSTGSTENPEDICKLPEVRGNCRAMMTRYKWDHVGQRCVMFHFGGCDGNANNFVSEKKCLDVCSKSK